MARGFFYLPFIIEVLSSPHFLIYFFHQILSFCKNEGILQISNKFHVFLLFNSPDQFGRYFFRFLFTFHCFYLASLFLLLFYMTFSLFPTSPFVTSYFPTTFSNTFPILLSLPLPTLFLFLILLSLPLYYFFIPISQIFYIETSNHPIYF